LADDAEAAAAELEDPALTRARAELNEQTRAALSGESKREAKNPRPSEDDPPEVWSEWVDREYGWNRPGPHSTADMGETGPDRDSMRSFGEVFNEALRESRLGPKKQVEVIQLR
jgi:hypothetical protein